MRRQEPGKEPMSTTRVGIAFKGDGGWGGWGIQGSSVLTLAGTGTGTGSGRTRSLEEAFAGRLTLGVLGKGSGRGVCQRPGWRECRQGVPMQTDQRER